MPWCTGILFGEVYSAKGPVPNTMVDIDWIKGETTGLKLSFAASEDNPKANTYVMTDDAGKYALPFVWFPGGSETSVTDSTKFLSIRTFTNSGAGSDRKIVRGCVCINFKALLSGVIPMEFTTLEGVELGKDLLLAFRKVNMFPPIHKVFLTSELKGIAAKANFFV